MAGQSNILVTPSELRSEAGKIEKIKGEYEAEIQKLYRIINSLEGRWQGEGRNAYYEQFAAAKPTFTKFGNMLDMFVVEMRDYANAMESKDAEGARNIRKNISSFT